MLQSSAKLHQKQAYASCGTACQIAMTCGQIVRCVKLILLLALVGL